MTTPSPVQTVEQCAAGIESDTSLPCSTCSAPRPELGWVKYINAQKCANLFRRCTATWGDYQTIPDHGLCAERPHRGRIIFAHALGQKADASSSSLQNNVPPARFGPSCPEGRGSDRKCEQWPVVLA